MGRGGDGLLLHLYCYIKCYNNMLLYTYCCTLNLCKIQDFYRCRPKKKFLSANINFKACMSLKVVVTSICVVRAHQHQHQHIADMCTVCAPAYVNLFPPFFPSVLYLLCQATNESSLWRRNLIWANLTAAAKVRRAECHFNPINFNLLVIKELGCWRMAVSQALYYTG